MYWYRKDPSPADMARIPLLRWLKANAYYPIVYEVWLQQEAPDTNMAEIADVGGGAHFDGSATAAVVYYDSSSANDDAGNVGITTITIFGVDENGTGFQEVTDTMDGPTGTATAEKWTRLNNFKAATAGANGDAEGNIFLQDDAAGTTKHLQIAAATVGCMNARFYFPYGWTGVLAAAEVSAYKAAHATEGFGDSADATISGILFQPIYKDNNLTNVANDLIPVYPVTPIESPKMFYDLTPHIAQTEDEECYITIEHVTKEADNNYLGFYKLWYVAYKNTAAGRGMG